MKSKKVSPEVVSIVDSILAPFKIDFQDLLDQSQSLESNSEKKYLTFTESAKYTGLSRWTLARQVKANKLPQIKLSSSKQGTVLFDRADLDKWMKSLKRNGGVK